MPVKRIRGKPRSSQSFGRRGWKRQDGKGHGIIVVKRRYRRSYIPLLLLACIAIAYGLLQRHLVGTFDIPTITQSPPSVPPSVTAEETSTENVGGIDASSWITDGDANGVREMFVDVDGLWNATINRDNGDILDVWYAMNCSEGGEERDKLVPTAEDWKKARRAYELAVGKDKSTLPDNHEENGTGAQVKYSIEVDPIMNRGVFAQERITNGTLVWNYDYIVMIENGAQFRIFVMNVPRMYSCYMLYQWIFATYATEDENGDMLINVEVDYSVFFNQASPETINVVSCNGHGDGFCHGRSAGLYASRDIDVGEQLLMTYAHQYFINWYAIGMATEDTARKKKLIRNALGKPVDDDEAMD
uniref:SET domain-containing protein n=1 Tax=Craspedostauros australis TaxID=1486917 RepID=A0A7R9WRM8_9STRA|mmetsp:Transcript_17530/g.48641  ORF Transcript_17530/g.48641 Transcript_17530/m.48641 type:complete len:359 (+) Transcript_17530:209-1285(+)|eukprot:CAMPEP_0198121512 /NCGR_PEP_ID=MMETSP1442-20131203/32350_1 /TAXON_ID= /ORGANISM="Craspedostauros australis, Strain CCMP3328" /LENGTH=358 /DNA_ID=CAMNT_0043780335 /DNA_START=155 /DNA_END=1231 /DNA_ORIENTATION=+